jgi:hypothetical protein
MIVVEPMKAAHLASLTVQAAQHAWRNDMTEEHFELLAAPDAAWSVFDGTRLVMCAGVIEAGVGRGEAWALLAPDSGPAMTGITRAVRRYLHATSFRRIEAVVAVNFSPGRRWAKMLGFRFEGLMAAYLDDGSDAERWARVK